MKIELPKWAWVAIGVFLLVLIAACSIETTVDEKEYSPKSGSQTECYELELSDDSEVCVSKEKWDATEVGDVWKG